MIVERTFEIPSTHPCLPGHFPDQPVVPGVVLLDQVAKAWLARNDDQQLCRIVSVKFLAPVLPQQPVTVRLDSVAQSRRVKFQCAVDTRVVVKGELEFDAGP